MMQELRGVCWFGGEPHGGGFGADTERGGTPYGGLLRATTGKQAGATVPEVQSIPGSNLTGGSLPCLSACACAMGVVHKRV